MEDNGAKYRLDEVPAADRTHRKPGQKPMLQFLGPAGGLKARFI